MPKNRTSKTAALRAVQRQLNSPYGVPYAKNKVVSDAWRNMSRRQRKRVLAAMKEPTDYKRTFAGPRTRRDADRITLETVNHAKTCALYRGAKTCDCAPAIKVRNVKAR